MKSHICREPVTAAVEYVSSHYNPTLAILGYLVSRYKSRRVYQQTYLAGMREHFGKMVFDTTIDDLSAFERSVTDAIPITRHSPTSNAARIARRFFDETLRRITESAPAAKAAFARSIGRKASLPLGDERAVGEAPGLTRLRGAFMVVIGLLKPDPTQPRKTFAPEKLTELTASIAARGIRQPIRVRRDSADGKYFIIAGERRYRAAVAAGLTEMPCILADTQASDGREILIDQVIENWQRADLEPVELHDALVRLRDEGGMTQDEIATATGKSKSEVSRFLSLGKVNPEIMEEARTNTTGRFGRTTLEALAQVSDDQQQGLAAKVREGSLSAKEVEREARRL